MTVQKGFAPILILAGILILVGVVGGAYFLGRQTLSLRGASETSDVAILPTSSPIPDASPAPNGTGEIANWKTYNDPLGVFSINYPANWYVSKDSKNVIRKNDNNPIFLGAIAPCIPNSQDCIYSRQVITFEILHKPANLGIDKFAEDDPSLCQEVKTSNTYSYNPCTGLTGVVNKKFVQVNGKEAVWIVTSSAPSGEKLEILIPRNQTEVIMIHTYKNRTGSSDLDPEYIKIINQILSTFKFIP